MGHMDMAVGMSEQAVFLDLDDIGLYSPRANSLTIYVSVASFIINLFKIPHFPNRYPYPLFLDFISPF